MDRITQTDLEILVHRINEITDSPTEPYAGPGNANVGNYHLDYAYGGVKLSRMANNVGGIRNISTDGFGTKRQLHSWLQAFLAGMDNA